MTIRYTEGTGAAHRYVNANVADDGSGTLAVSVACRSMAEAVEVFSYMTLCRPKTYSNVRVAKSPRRSGQTLVIPAAKLK